ncbi:MAG: hypothetical protein HY763_16500 [Planctomycetes bacterium]|nr:hypothetical protein [Planctomycetota bacterium]
MTTSQNSPGLSARLYQAGVLLNDSGADVSVVDIRAEVNALVARMVVTLVTLLKGTGYLAAHPLQRLAREALFLLGWSAPPAVQVRTLEGTWSAAPAPGET